MQYDLFLLMFLGCSLNISAIFHLLIKPTANVKHALVFKVKYSNNYYAPKMPKSAANSLQIIVGLKHERTMDREKMKKLVNKITR